MFSISNEIAYDGLMVQAVEDRPSPIADGLSPWLPRSCWLNVNSEAEKWSPAEGEAVLDLLWRLAGRGIRDPSLYVISPFREVADRLRGVVATERVFGALGIPERKRKDWGGSHIGTVHTFQGKETEVVFLVLGASAVNRQGSRNWAGATPNILNVAATRAKQAIYVIGRHDVWSTAVSSLRHPGCCRSWAGRSKPPTFGPRSRMPTVGMRRTTDTARRRSASTLPVFDARPFPGRTVKCQSGCEPGLATPANA